MQKKMQLNKQKSDIVHLNPAASLVISLGVTCFCAPMVEKSLACLGGSAADQPPRFAGEQALWPQVLYWQSNVSQMFGEVAHRLCRS